MTSFKSSEHSITVRTGDLDTVANDVAGILGLQLGPIGTFNNPAVNAEVLKVNGFPPEKALALALNGLGVTEGLLGRFGSITNAQEAVEIRFSGTGRSAGEANADRTV